MTSNLTEIKGDLFDAKECLCHCVSADFYMGKGIAVEFKERFGHVDELLSQKKVYILVFLSWQNSLSD
jgi:hypothetical protein